MALLHFLINWLASAGDSPPDTNQGKEFKEEAVRLLATSGKTAKELGRELGVTGMSLANWRDQAIFNGDHPEQARLDGVRIHYSVLKLENARLKKELEAVRQAFAQSRQTYGSPRITRQLQRQHISCGENRVARLMRRHHLQAKSKRPFRPRTTQSRHLYGVAPNRLRQQAPPTAVNQTWVADITYISTAGGWIYLAGVMDLYSRKIVGWSLGYSLQTPLVKEALQQALALRRPAAGLLHHSDRGIQYASSAFQALLHSQKIIPSMSAAGHCYDNANMESFWSTLKTELIHRGTFPNLPQAKSALFEYIEVFYNRQRLHSALGYKSPVEFEELLTYK